MLTECLKIFSLVVGYPPFESMFSDEKSLVAEWVASLGSLPQEWDGIVMEFKEISTHMSATIPETF
jgi:hypothetical protein